MYAIVRSGNRQYRAEIGRVLDVERLPHAVDSQIELDDVLLLRDEDGAHIGQPRVAGVRVLATVIEQKRAAKVIVLKYRQRTSYRRKQGHRQYITRLRIDDIRRES